MGDVLKWNESVHILDIVVVVVVADIEVIVDVVITE